MDPVASPMGMAASIPVNVPRGLVPIALISVMPAMGAMDVAGLDDDSCAVMAGTSVGTVEVAAYDGCRQNGQGD